MKPTTQDVTKHHHLSLQGKSQISTFAWRLTMNFHQFPKLTKSAEERKKVKKVSGDQERNSIDKLDQQMHRSRYMLEKEATISTRSQKAPRHAIHLLQRRVNPGRMYQQNNDRISYEELLGFDQNIDELRSFTQRDVKWREIKDLTGKVIDPEKTGNGSITLYVERFEDDGKKRSSVDHDKRQSLKKETKVRIQGRFYEAFRSSLLSLLQEHSS